MWTQQEAIAVATQIEQLVIPLGCHSVLGGSCLHRGGSDKDCDIFIYPHNTDKGYKVQAVIDLLFANNFAEFEHRNHTEYRDAKLVFKSATTDKRIDFFFL